MERKELNEIIQKLQLAATSPNSCIMGLKLSFGTQYTSAGSPRDITIQISAGDTP